MVNNKPGATLSIMGKEVPMFTNMGFSSVCYKYVLLLLFDYCTWFVGWPGKIDPGGNFKWKYGEKVGRKRETPCRLLRCKVSEHEQ